jgi:cytochrome c oxidase assembly factor CtaG
VLLHAFHDVNLGAWHFEPTVIAGTFIVVSFYFYGALTRQGSFVPWRAALFLLGVTAMFLALVSPLDAAADRLLSMHMLQHVVLTTIGPPLVLLGLPPGILSGVFANARVANVARVLFHPVVTATLFIVNMWLWHVPPVYGFAIEKLWAHITMHLAFMATGILFWWPVIQPAPEVGRVGDGARLLYLFATGMPMALLALMFFASGNVIYDYYDKPDPLWGFDPMDDQQVAGLVMGALGELASFAAITWLFFRFLEREEQQAAEQQAPQAHAAQGHPVDAGPAT